MPSLPSSEALPVETSIRESDTAVLDRLREAQRLITAYPRVTRAVVSAFAAEGRRFSQTEEGRTLREALLRSPYLKRARLGWSAFGLDALATPTSGFEPTWWIGTLVAAAASPRLEELLSRLLVDDRRRRP